MSKSVQLSIKVESELRDLFAVQAAKENRTISQMLREYMWSVVERDHQPNEETIAAIEEIENGGGAQFDSMADLFRDLGVPCEK